MKKMFLWSSTLLFVFLIIPKADAVPALFHFNSVVTDSSYSYDTGIVGEGFQLWVFLDNGNNSFGRRIINFILVS